MLSYPFDVLILFTLSSFSQNSLTVFSNPETHFTVRPASFERISYAFVFFTLSFIPNVMAENIYFLLHAPWIEPGRFVQTFIL